MRIAIDPGKSTGWAAEVDNSFGTTCNCDTPEGLRTLWKDLSNLVHISWGAGPEDVPTVIVERYRGRLGETLPHEIIGLVKTLCAILSVPVVTVNPPPRKIVERVAHERESTDRHSATAIAMLMR